MVLDPSSCSSSSSSSSSSSCCAEGGGGQGTCQEVLIKVVDAGEGGAAERGGDSNVRAGSVPDALDERV